MFTVTSTISVLSLALQLVALTHWNDFSNPDCIWKHLDATSCCPSPWCHGKNQLHCTSWSIFFEGAAFPPVSLFPILFCFFGIDFVALMAIYIVVQDTVLELEFQGVKKQFTMLQVVYFSMLLIFTTLVALLTRLMEDWRMSTLLIYVDLQAWPVRTPRPVLSKLAADTPLLTGQVGWSEITLWINLLILLFRSF